MSSSKRLSLSSESANRATARRRFAKVGRRSIARRSSARRMKGSLRLLVSAPWVRKIRCDRVAAGSSSSFRNSLPRRTGVGGADAVARRQAPLGEHRPLGGPLLGHGGRHHHDHGALAAGGFEDRDRDGEGDVGLAHADLVGEHEPGLVVEAPEDLGGGALLAVGVVVGHAIVAEADPRAQLQFIVAPPRARRERRRRARGLVRRGRRRDGVRRSHRGPRRRARRTPATVDARLRQRASRRRRP